MVNQIGPRFFVIDTPSSTPVWLAWVDVLSIIWSETTAAGHQATVKNASGTRIIFDAKSSEAADFEMSHWGTGWVEGLLIDTLGSGKLVIVCQ